jgi:hypothetical protein
VVCNRSTIIKDTHKTAENFMKEINIDVVEQKNVSVF